MKANKEGHMEQTEDHSSSSNRVAPFFNNMRSHLPVVLIVGQYYDSLSEVSVLIICQAPRTRTAL